MVSCYGSGAQQSFDNNYYYDLRITDVIPATFVHMITADIFDAGRTGLARITLRSDCVVYYYVR